MKAAKVAVAVLLATIGTQSASAPPTMEEALSAYQLHLYGRPVEVLRMHAEQGNARAQSTLGQMYVDGTRGIVFGIPEDDAEAARWLQLAAEQGHARAQMRLGLMYARGEGVPKDDAEAMRWLRLAAEQGEVFVQDYLQNISETGSISGGGIVLIPTIDSGTIQKVWEALTRDGFASARTAFQIHAEQGNAVAQYHLGFMYAHGQGGPEDDAEAARWYRLAAEQGLARAQFKLGYMYADGKGVPEDDAEAVRWSRLAAEQGHSSAQYNLGVMYDNGEGVPEDDIEAVRWYRLAAEQGHPDAQFKLGYMYANGKGVPEDDAEAMRRSRLAAEQGDAGAQYNLGVMYANGEGVPQDYAEALRWFRLAAEQSNVAAQSNMGVMYANGEGVPQDYAEALRWFRLAAEQGDAAAQNHLGAMYEFASGVPQDFVQAHKWYNLAASRTSSSDPDLREKAVRSRDRIATRLTPAQLARAQRLAREWRPGASAAEPPVREQRPSISAVPAPRASNTGANGTRDRIANLQQALRRLGYDPGLVDGIPGARTRAAIRAFQADTGLPVTGQVSERLESAVLAALVAAGQTPAPTSEPTHRPLERESTGSGFRVSGQGHVLTNAHVVRGCTEVHIPPGGVVEVMAREGSSDLALLRAPAGTSGAAAKFRQGRGIRPAASVVVMGYPLRGLLASEANVSTGAVSALAGPGDDRRLIQITAPVQPGNSGGPVLDAAGNVVGVVVAKLDAIKIARSTGDIPQNVNFAVSAGTARAFLDAEGIPYETAPSDPALEPAEVAAAARKFTVSVECWK